MKFSPDKEIKILNFEMQNQVTSSPGIVDMATPISVNRSSSCNKEADEQESCIIDLSSEDEIILNDSSQDLRKFNNSPSIKDESKVSFASGIMSTRKRKREEMCTIISGENNNLSILEVVQDPPGKTILGLDSSILEVVQDPPGKTILGLDSKLNKDMKIGRKSGKKEKQDVVASESSEFEIIEVVDNSGIEEKLLESVKGCNSKKRKLKKQDYLYLKPSDFNNSVEILPEISAEPRSKKKRKNTNKQQSVKCNQLQSENCNESVVNLCGDEDEDIVFVDLSPSNPVELRKAGPRTDDIIPLSSEQNVILKATPKRKKNFKKMNRPAKKQKSKSNAFKMPPPVNTNVHYAPFMYGPSVQPPSNIMPYYFVDTVGNTSDVYNNSEPSQITSQSKKPVQVSPLNNAYGSNIYNPNPQHEQRGLRPIIIDGSNVAFGHSVGTKVFSCRGLEICINYFLKRGHKVVAFVPQFRRSSHHVPDRSILEELEKKGLVVFTPSRRVEGQLQVPYDDRFIVQYAAEVGGVIVSTDNYRDLLQENESWRETIQERLLMFTWVGDLLMFPQDPLGRYGPSLEDFLSFPS